jgi:L-rhamnose isomerase/sugar isomerase
MNQIIISKISELQIAIPSWALGTGGTRFGRFPGAGEPGSLEEKIADVTLLKRLNPSVSGISLHIPWDIPKDVAGIRQQLDEAGLKIESVNSNTFQDQPGQVHSYKFGSLCDTDNAVRNQAIAHNLEVVEHGKDLGAKSLTVWLADGSNFPGQQHFRRAYENTLESLKAIYDQLPNDWTLLLEYKPYEPNFYSMVIPDWGTSYSLCQQLGPRAQVLVDLGHHLPNTNIEQIVARLLLLKRLGGFHFNGSMYGDDDLTTGAIKPYQLFLIFNELADAAGDTSLPKQKIDYMIDASHNVKDPLEDLLQSLEAIQIAYAQALLVDQLALQTARENNDVALAQILMQDAFRTDVRQYVAKANELKGGSANPFLDYRQGGYRELLIKQRGSGRATGL